MISSRTPEGSTNDCPVCGQQVRIEPSFPKDDAPCPHCGHLLWFEKPQEDSIAAVRKAEIARERTEKTQVLDQVLELEIEWR
jgi:hypothetical protein